MVTIDERIKLLEERITLLESALLKFSTSIYNAYSSDIPFFYERMKEVGVNLTMLHRDISNIKDKVGIADDARGVTIQ